MYLLADLLAAEGTQLGCARGHEVIRGGNVSFPGRVRVSDLIKQKVE